MPKISQMGMLDSLKESKPISSFNNDQLFQSSLKMKEESKSISDGMDGNGNQVQCTDIN